MKYFSGEGGDRFQGRSALVLRPLRLPRLHFGTKARGVFGYGALDLIGSAGWELSVDLHGDVERCVGIARVHAAGLGGTRRGQANGSDL